MTTKLNHVERMTAESMTAVVKQMFGPDFYAVKRRVHSNGGRRAIMRVWPGSLGYDGVYGETWAECLDQAKKKFASCENCGRAATMKLNGHKVCCDPDCCDLASEQDEPNIPEYL